MQTTNKERLAKLEEQMRKLRAEIAELKRLRDQNPQDWKTEAKWQGLPILNI